jgi:hypothetical protein
MATKRPHPKWVLVCPLSNPCHSILAPECVVSQHSFTLNSCERNFGVMEFKGVKNHYWAVIRNRNRPMVITEWTSYDPYPQFSENPSTRFSSTLLRTTSDDQVFYFFLMLSCGFQLIHHYLCQCQI